MTIKCYLFYNKLVFFKKNNNKKCYSKKRNYKYY